MMPDKLPKRIKEAAVLSNNRVNFNWPKIQKDEENLFSKKISRNCSGLKKELHSKYQDASNKFQQSCYETRVEIDKKQFSLSQWQPDITLFPKWKNKNYLENWRSVSVIHVQTYEKMT